jgi:hypothetical protein
LGIGRSEGASDVRHSKPTARIVVFRHQFCAARPELVERVEITEAKRPGGFPDLVFASTR